MAEAAGQALVISQQGQYAIPYETPPYQGQGGIEGPGCGQLATAILPNDAMTSNRFRGILDLISSTLLRSKGKASFRNGEKNPESRTASFQFGRLGVQK